MHNLWFIWTNIAWYLRVQKVLKQPSSQNSHGALRESSLRPPNRLVLKKPRPLAIRAFITVAKPWRFIFPVIADVKMSFIGKLKLISNGILQASKMFGHGFYSQTCIRSCIAQARDILKWSYYRVHLLIVLSVPPVNLFKINEQQFSQWGQISSIIVVKEFLEICCSCLSNKLSIDMKAEMIIHATIC